MYKLFNQEDADKFILEQMKSYIDACDAIDSLEYQGVSKQVTEPAKDRSMIMPLPPPDSSRVIGANPNLGAPYIHPIYGTIGITPQKAQPAVFTLPAGCEVDVEMIRYDEDGMIMKNSECQHDFKEYQGFTESYRYCTKCDHKVEQ